MVKKKAAFLTNSAGSTWGQHAEKSKSPLWRGPTRSTQSTRSVEQLGQKSSLHHLYQGARKLHSLLCIAYKERVISQQCFHFWPQRNKDTDLQAYRSTGGTNSSQRKQYQLAPEITRLAKGKHKNPTNRNQGHMATSEPSSPTTASHRYPNTPEKQELDLKSYLMMLIEGLKKNLKTPLKKYRTVVNG